nr:unnamed protein product [Callosobruchus analis]
MRELLADPKVILFSHFMHFPRQIGILNKSQFGLTIVQAKVKIGLFLVFLCMWSTVQFTVENIMIKFFKPGHTFMAADASHHQVELALKRQKRSDEVFFLVKQNLKMNLSILKDIFETKYVKDALAKPQDQHILENRLKFWKELPVSEDGSDEANEKSLLTRETRDEGSPSEIPSHI